jgi:hypothetical protein
MSLRLNHQKSSNPSKSLDKSIKEAVRRGEKDCSPSSARARLKGITIARGILA